MSGRICYFCQYKANGEALSESHLRTHTKEKPFQCVQTNCFSSFARKSHLNTHCKLVHKIVKFTQRQKTAHSCYFCSRDYTCESHLADHLLYHTRERPYKCVYSKCKKFCWSKGARNQHALFCNYNPDLKNNLQKRDKLNRKVLIKSQFQCYFCLKNFQTKKNLFAHIKRHTGELHVSCIGCKNQFNYRDLRKHTRICVKSRKIFVCPLCNSSKASSSELNWHIQRVHTKDYPKTKCYFCGASVLEGLIRRHLTTHTKEKAYKCGDCKWRFAHYKNLKNHIGLKHRDTEEGNEVRKQLRRKCYFCKKYFANYTYLRLHMVIHTMETRRV